MINRKLIVALALAAPAGVFADGIAPTDTIIVTATRTAIPLTEAIVPMTVISREQIEQSLATDLSELLRFEAGIDVGRNGGPGQATSVFLRGTESNHTLVLVDGVRVNPGTIGGAAIQHIAPEVIERIEIVKGGRSSLYGTDAIGGVINIITRKAAAPYLEAGAGAGSFDHRTGFLSGGNRTESGEFGATLNWQATDGYAVRTDSDLRRGYDNLSASLYGKRDFSFGDLTARYWRASGTVEYLDFFLAPLDQDFLNESVALELNNRHGESASTRVIVSYSKDDIEQNQTDSFVTSKRLAFDGQYSVDLGEHALAAGLFLADENAGTGAFGSGFDEDTATRAVFVQDSLTAGSHRMFVAARYTDHESFGGELTWNAEYAFEPNELWVLNAGIGHAFRAPDASDRYGFGGNVDLRPEVSDEIQLGAEFRPTPRQVVRLDLYRNDIDDLIEFDLADYTLRNIGLAEIRGAELGYEYNSERFVFRADLVSQRADNASDGVRLLRRAEESLSVNYTQMLGAHRVGISVLATGDREDFSATLPGYVLANLTGQFQLYENWQINARIENVLDKHYETAAQYRMQGRSAFVELTYRWK